MEDRNCHSPDSPLAQTLPGLSDELSAYFTAQLDRYRTRRKNKGARVILFDEQGNPIDEEKASEAPGHLISIINSTLRLDRLREHGYPKEIELSPYEWEALDALLLARMKDQEQESEEQAEQNNQDAERARLQALRNRGR